MVTLSPSVMVVGSIDIVGDVWSLIAQMVYWKEYITRDVNVGFESHADEKRLPKVVNLVQALVNGIYVHGIRVRLCG